MNVTISESVGCRRELFISADAAECLPDYRNTMNQYRATAKVSGFRKGKIPDHILEKHFGESIAKDVEVSMIERLSIEAFNREALDIASTARVSDVEYGREKGISFKVNVDVSPEVTLPDYRAFEIERRPVTVSDEQLEKARLAFLDDYATFQDVKDRGIIEGDVAQVDYVGTIDGTPIAEGPDVALILRSDGRRWVRIGEPEFIPGAPAQLLGASVGDERMIAVDFPESFMIKRLAGRSAQYRIKVLAVKEKIRPSVDEALLSRLGLKSEEELRAFVRDILLKRAEEQEEDRLRSSVVDWLCERCDFPLPESLVLREAQKIRRDLVASLLSSGVSEEEAKTSTNAIMRESMERAIQRVRVTYILMAITEAENVTVTNEEVNERIAQRAARENKTPERIRKELGAPGLASIREDLLYSKTLLELLHWVKVK